MKIQITKVPNSRAEGGWLSHTHGSDFDSGLDFVAEGNSHEQNPFGGVMVGHDGEGTPNLVEEGEYIWNGDYVFSKRMKVPKKLAKKYGLGGDITFADAIKKLTKDSEERPLSMIDRDTNDHILGEFADVQEERRMAKAQRAMEREQQLQEDFMTGFQYGLGGHLSPFGIVPNSDNISPFEKAEQQFADGGDIKDADLVDWIIREEGFNKKPEDIGDGKMTLGSGLTSKKWHDLYRKRGNKWSAEDNRMAVAEEVANRRRWAEKTIPNWEALPDSSQKALLSYKYNYDFTPTNSPKLFKALADSNLYEAAKQMDATSKDPKFKKGLMDRRKREQEWFLSDVADNATPVQAPVTTNTSMIPLTEPAVSTAVRNNYVPATTTPYNRGNNMRKAFESAVAFNRMMDATSLQNNPLPEYQFPIGYANGGGIHIDPSKRGTFKAQASKMGMGVQEAASHILANKENYSPAMVKKANFARNSSKWHEDGGSLFTNPFAYGGEMGNIFEGEGDRPNSFTWGTDFSSAPWVRNMKRLTSNPKSYLTFEELQAIQKAREAAKKYQEAVKQQKAQEVASNKGKGNGKKAKATSTPRNTDVANAAALSAAVGPTGLNLYDWYRNGSDGISEPTGFTVGENGLIDRKTGYTQEYRDLVKKRTADDIRKWAAKHPNDPSLQSFLANNGPDALNKLTDEQWRTGALDGKYGFMHHVANDMLQNPQTPQEEPKTAAPAATRGTILLDEDGKLTPIDAATEDMIFEQEMPGEYGNVQIYKRKPKEAAADTTKPVTEKVDDTTGNGKFKPRPTWMRQMPIWMSGLAALRGELTPPDYTNADAILSAAYAAGRPVSVGTEYVGDYRVRDPFDERYLMNIINQNAAATRENLMNFSGGNRAVAMSGMMNNDLTRQMALAEAARQAYLANRADDAQVSDFNYRTNKGNADAQNTRNLALAQLNSGRQNAMLSGVAQGARLRQAIKDQRDAAISANWTAFAQNMGDWGKENGYYNMLGGLNEEGVLKYFYGDDWKTKFNNVNG